MKKWLILAIGVIIFLVLVSLTSVIAADPPSKKCESDSDCTGIYNYEENYSCVNKSYVYKIIEVNPEKKISRAENVICQCKYVGGGIKQCLVKSIISNKNSSGDEVPLCTPNWTCDKSWDIRACRLSFIDVYAKTNPEIYYNYYILQKGYVERKEMRWCFDYCGERKLEYRDCKIILNDITNETKKVCIDSDNGIDYYDNSTVTLITYDKYSYAEAEYKDQCNTDNKTLVEWYCEENEVKSENYNCPSICKDGACIKEQEIIKKKNIFQKIWDWLKSIFS